MLHRLSCKGSLVLGEVEKWPLVPSVERACASLHLQPASACVGLHAGDVFAPVGTTGSASLHFAADALARIIVVCSSDLLDAPRSKKELIDGKVMEVIANWPLLFTLVE